MSKIKNIESTPSYISEFLNRHMDSLIHIHDEGMKEHGDGCLGFKCSENDNKMDVFYMDRDTILTTISEESWEQIKISMNHKKRYASTFKICFQFTANHFENIAISSTHSYKKKK